MMPVPELEFLCEAYAGASWDLNLSSKFGKLFWTLVPEDASLRILHAASARALAAAIHLELLRCEHPRPDSRSTHTTQT